MKRKPQWRVDFTTMPAVSGEEMTMKLTSKYQTVATVGYTGSVSRNENRAAHGAVCHLQARRNAAREIVGRRVNSNGRHQETGEAFALDADTLAHWESIERSSR